MSEKVLTEMNESEFREVMDGYMERSSYEYGEMPISTFFELLFETEAQRVTETIELDGQIVDGKLEFLFPTDQEATIQTRGNQILVGDQLIVVNLKNGHSSPVGMIAR